MHMRPACRAPTIHDVHELQASACSPRRGERGPVGAGELGKLLRAAQGWVSGEAGRDGAAHCDHPPTQPTNQPPAPPTRDEDASHEVPALSAHLDVRRPVVLDAQYPLQGAVRCRAGKAGRCSGGQRQ